MADHNQQQKQEGAEPADRAAAGSGSSYGQRTHDQHTHGRRVDRLMAEYADSHRNIFNLLIHWFAVPVIFWCILAALWIAPFPGALAFVSGLNWAWIAAAVTMVYYLTLSPTLALAMAGFIALCFFIIVAYLNWGDLPLWQLAIALFVVAWLFQFIGHKIEGKAPSFFKDLQFLLVGPAWLMGFVLRLFGIKY